MASPSQVRVEISPKSGRPQIAFDRIITSRDIAVANTGVHKSVSARVASDHLPVWAMLDMAAGS